MLYEAGAAISGENPYTVGFRVGRLLESRERLAAMREAARRLGRPRAAFEVAAELGRLAGD
jgi:UDP-N-acetylglucosamine:LPS N-acetylglucosamine transferase